MEQTSHLDQLLQYSVERGASDLHLSAGYPPCIRVDGEIIFLNEHPPLTSSETESMLLQILPDKNRQEFAETNDSDFAYRLPGIGRFRVNAFCDSVGVGAVFRSVPETPPAIEDLDLGFSGVLRNLCMHTKGLIIVTGPTGCGKSTTLAAMVDLINRTRKEHIITIEDPIEFSHRSKECLINQREVHRHTQSFPAALRAALREDPDVILLGEMRDLVTTEIALETAETGHLVLATLHTNTATSTVDRIIDKFPGDRQNQIRTLLANTLTAVIAQTLCKRIDGGRAAAAEILLATPAVRSNIRDQKTHQLPTAIQTGYNLGMRSFNDSLFQLVVDGVISPREAYLKAVDKPSLEQKLDGAGIPLDKSLVDIPLSQTGEEDDTVLSPDRLREKAWRLATNRNTAARDGQQAVILVQQAIEKGSQSAETYMTLAAAHAQNDDFKAATDAAKQAIQIAKRERNSACVREVEGHLAHYRKSRALPGPEHTLRQNPIQEP